MTKVNCRRDADWRKATLQALASDGFCVIEEVLNEPFLAGIRAAMYRTRDAIHAEVGLDRLRQAGELGVLRLMLRFDSIFFRILESPVLLAVVDDTVSPTAILHLQNGFILPSFQPAQSPKVFQNTFHRDFPRYLNGYIASINMLFAIDPFRRDNGATFVVPASHQRSEAPTQADIEAAVPVECAAGAMVVFDSTLWHAAGENSSGRDRLAINHQFTRSWIKQQIDYVRALGDMVAAQPARTQQLLGQYTRVVTSLDEYYRPESERLYRKGQG